MDTRLFDKEITQICVMALEKKIEELEEIIRGIDPFLATCGNGSEIVVTPASARVHALETGDSLSWGCGKRIIEVIKDEKEHLKHRRDKIQKVVSVLESEKRWAIEAESMETRQLERIESCPKCHELFATPVRMLHSSKETVSCPECGYVFEVAK